MRKSMQTRYGSEGVSRLIAWLEFIDISAGLSEAQQVDRVNDFFNQQIRYRNGIDLRQERDYWATPLETLGAQAADCEDYTVAKYITLLQLGVPAERLRLIYVKAQIGGSESKIYSAHMVLGYYPPNQVMPLVLDNLTASVQPAEAREDLHPLFSFNSNYLPPRQRPSLPADATAYLSPWRDLLNRSRGEGLSW